jgi:hypothetical protein
MNFADAQVFNYDYMELDNYMPRVFLVLNIP